MEVSEQAAVRAIVDEADDLMDQVEAALDEHAEFSVMFESRRRVDDVARRYRELLASFSEADRSTVERGIGRRVVDLQKLASRLPSVASGNPASAKTKSEFFETRPPTSSRPPVTIGVTSSGRQEPPPKFRVGGEVESWCGPCDDMRSHVIIAMVGGEPAQVTCQSCGAKHKHKSESPKKKAPRSVSARPASPVDREASKRAAEKQHLLDELRNAQNVRPVAPGERYRSGEIIDHPEHGRGKVDTVLPRSMLVRFASGLKTVKLT
ncbi:MAG: hypothetical protein HY698_15755 [Deltaproteobacteria bacterium]|nr:hypothetical protein [Deltaproteobacteria bacterium]